MNAMPDPRPLTFLCITTYEKGQDFMRECKRQGCSVILLTAEKLRDADWPRESLDDTFYLPAEIPLAEIVQAVTHLARTQKLDRIVALDEFDMETASTLREQVRQAAYECSPRRRNLYHLHHAPHQRRRRGLATNQS